MSLKLFRTVLDLKIPRTICELDVRRRADAWNFVYQTERLG